MADRQPRRAGLSLPGGRRLGASGLEPSLTILYLAIVALWTLLMAHFGVPLDAPILLPLPGRVSMLPSPVLTCVIVLACAGVGVSYVNRRGRPAHAPVVVLTILLPTALVLLPYQWLHSTDGVWFALVAALTTGAMMALMGLPSRLSAREAAGRAAVAAALVACGLMPWLAAQRGADAFWTFAPSGDAAATVTEADVTEAAERLSTSWEATPIQDRGGLCEEYLTSALRLHGLGGMDLVVKPGQAGRVARTGSSVTLSVATVAAPDAQAVLDGLNAIVAEAAS